MSAVDSLAMNHADALRIIKLVNTSCPIPRSPTTKDNERLLIQAAFDASARLKLERTDVGAMSAEDAINCVCNELKRYQARNDAATRHQIRKGLLEAAYIPQESSDAGTVSQLLSTLISKGGQVPIPSQQPVKVPVPGQKRRHSWTEEEFSWDGDAMALRPIKTKIEVPVSVEATGPMMTTPASDAEMETTCAFEEEDLRGVDIVDLEPAEEGATPSTASAARCLVRGCATPDLSSLKKYHKRYRLCVQHLKAERLVVGGQLQRFCQQCGRFQKMSEFVGAKRSCRFALDSHNSRRRSRKSAQLAGDLPPGMSTPGSEQSSQSIAPGTASPAAVASSTPPAARVSPMRAAAALAVSAAARPRRSSTPSEISSLSSAQLVAATDHLEIPEFSSGGLSVAGSPPSSAMSLDLPPPSTLAGLAAPSTAVSMDLSTEVHHGHSVNHHLAGLPDPQSDMELLERLDMLEAVGLLDLPGAPQPPPPLVRAMPDPEPHDLASILLARFINGEVPQQHRPAGHQVPPAQPPPPQFPLGGGNPTGNDLHSFRSLLEPTAMFNPDSILMGGSKEAGAQDFFEPVAFPWSAPAAQGSAQMRMAQGKPRSAADAAAFAMLSAPNTGLPYPPSSAPAPSQDMRVNEQMQSLNIKLLDRNPADLPSSLRDSLANLAGASAKGLVGAIRPGCTNLSVDFVQEDGADASAMADGGCEGAVARLQQGPEGQWWREQTMVVQYNGRSILVKGGRVVRAAEPGAASGSLPVIDRVSPLCVVGGAPVRVVVSGRDLATPSRASEVHVRFAAGYVPVKLADAEVMGGAARLTAEVDLAGERAAARRCGLAFVECQDGEGEACLVSRSRPMVVVDCASIAAEVSKLEAEVSAGRLAAASADAFLVDLGRALDPSVPESVRATTPAAEVAGSLALVAKVLGAVCERGWVATTRRLLRALASLIGLAGARPGGMAAADAALRPAAGELTLIHRAVISREVNVVLMISELRGALMGMKRPCMGAAALLGGPLSAGPKGITPLHLAALIPDAGSLVNAVASTGAATVGWAAARAEDGATPSDYSRRPGASGAAIDTAIRMKIARATRVAGVCLSSVDREGSCPAAWRVRRAMAHAARMQPDMVIESSEMVPAASVDEEVSHVGAPRWEVWPREMMASAKDIAVARALLARELQALAAAAGKAPAPKEEVEEVEDELPAPEPASSVHAAEAFPDAVKEGAGGEGHRWEEPARGPLLGFVDPEVEASFSRWSRSQRGVAAVTESLTLLLDLVFCAMALSLGADGFAGGGGQRCLGVMATLQALFCVAPDGASWRGGSRSATGHAWWVLGLRAVSTCMDVAVARGVMSALSDQGWGAVSPAAVVVGVYLLRSAMRAVGLMLPLRLHAASMAGDGIVYLSALALAPKVLSSATSALAPGVGAAAVVGVAAVAAANSGAVYHVEKAMRAQFLSQCEGAAKDCAKGVPEAAGGVGGGKAVAC